MPATSKAGDRPRRRRKSRSDSGEPRAGELLRAGAQKIEREARGAEQRTAFRRVARFGLSSRVIVYAVLGGLMLDIAVGKHSPSQPDTGGALREVARQPGGPAWVALLALGLAGYAGFRLVQSVAGEPAALARRGAGWTRAGWTRAGWTRAGWTRVGWLASGLVYVSFCVEAVQLAAGAASGGGSDFNPRPFAAAVLRWPAGAELVGACGFVVAGAGIALGVWGVVHDYGQVLERDRLSSRELLVARLAGAVGDVARGLLVVLAASYLVDAAVTAKPGHAKSLDAAIQSLVGYPAGRELLGALAVGMLVYACYSLIEVRYRQI